LNYFEKNDLTPAKISFERTFPAFEFENEGELKDRLIEIFMPPRTREREAAHAELEREKKRTTQQRDDDVKIFRDALAKITDELKEPIKVAIRKVFRLIEQTDNRISLKEREARITLHLGNIVHAELYPSVPQDALWSCMDRLATIAGSI
jgi:hypothetical protein